MIFDLTQLKEKAPDAPAPRANVTLSGRSESIDNTYLKCRKLEYVHRVICGHRTRRKLAFDLYKTQVLDEFVKTLESSLVSKEDTQMNLALMKSLWPMPRSSTLDTYVNQIVGIRETTTPMEEMVNAISEHIANLTAGAAEKQKEEELAQEFARKRMDTSIMSSFKVRHARISSIETKYLVVSEQNATVISELAQEIMAEVDDIILSMKDSLPQFKKREQDLEYCLIKFVMAASLSNQRNGPRDNLKSESNLDLTNAVKTVMNECDKRDLMSVREGIANNNNLIADCWLYERDYRFALNDAQSSVHSAHDLLVRGTVELSKLGKILNKHLSHFLVTCVQNHGKYMKAIYEVEQQFIDSGLDVDKLEANMFGDEARSRQFLRLETLPRVQLCNEYEPRSLEDVELIEAEASPLYANFESLRNMRDLVSLAHPDRTKFGLASSVATVPLKDLPSIQVSKLVSKQSDTTMNRISNFVKSTGITTAVTQSQATTHPAVIVVTWDRYLHIFRSEMAKEPLLSLLMLNYEVKISHTNHLEIILIKRQAKSNTSTWGDTMDGIFKGNFIPGGNVENSHSCFRIVFREEDINPWKKLLKRAADCVDTEFIPMSIYETEKGTVLEPHASQRPNKVESTTVEQSAAQSILDKIRAAGGKVTE